MSGTLGFVLSAVEEGRPFSEAVRVAVRLGYAEPDPREDLSGRDVLRKGLILARLVGYEGRVPAAEDLVPPSLRKVGLDRFLAALPSLDEPWRRRAEAERAKGRALRYVVVATARGVEARLKAVPCASELGALRGTRNLLSFTTRRYREQPLVVAGPGAGPEVTAAGVLNDIQSLARGYDPWPWSRAGLARVAQPGGDPVHADPYPVAQLLGRGARTLGAQAGQCCARCCCGEGHTSWA